MATLPSPDPKHYSPVHVLSRPTTEREKLTAAFATSSLGRGPRWWQTTTGKAGLLWLALAVVLVWALPRLYKPTYVGVDPLDSQRITFYKRQWFGPTLSYSLEARFDKELKAWVWMAQDDYGQWYPFFSAHDQ